MGHGIVGVFCQLFPECHAMSSKALTAELGLRKGAIDLPQLRPSFLFTLQFLMADGSAAREPSQRNYGPCARRDSADRTAIKSSDAIDRRDWALVADADAPLPDGLFIDSQSRRLWWKSRATAPAPAVNGSLTIVAVELTIFLIFFWLKLPPFTLVSRK